MRDLVLVKSLEGGHHVDNINHVEVDHGKGSGKWAYEIFYSFVDTFYKTVQLLFSMKSAFGSYFLPIRFCLCLMLSGVSFAHVLDSISFFLLNNFLLSKR